MTRDEQRARNETLFRNLNERLKEIDDGLDTAVVGAAVVDREEFLCECGALDCMARLEMTRQEYEAVRAHPARFIVLGDHVDDAIETVVETHARYTVVQKHGEEADIARGTDPRSD
ncbi:MAG TPA: hypothetical protein VF895_11190 [Gaiellaceae bacterium]